jgi:hypothetical protein
METMTRAPVRGGRACVLGGIVGVAGGLVTMTVDPAVPDDLWRYPYTVTEFYIVQTTFVLNHVLLLAGMAGLAVSGAFGPLRYGRAGAWVGALGLLVLTLVEIWSTTLAGFRHPTGTTDVVEAGYGVATILIGGGLVAAGIAAIRAHVWSGLRRFKPLACGAAVFLIVLPGIFGPFLAGRIVLTVWMLLFTALGLALISEGKNS